MSLHPRRLGRHLLALALLVAAGASARAQAGLSPDVLEALAVAVRGFAPATPGAGPEPRPPWPDTAGVPPVVGLDVRAADPSRHDLLSPGHPWPVRDRQSGGMLPGRPPDGAARALPDSLPEGMPFYTGLLWGEHGLVRAAGLAPSTRRGELVLRRRMLQWHQRAGLATLGAMTAQVVLGELVASDRAGHQDLVPVHRTLGYVTFGMYLGTASLSLGAPPARRYGGGFGSVQLHRTLALVHFTGMMAQPWLGQHLAAAESPASYDARLRTHQWVGRITYTAFLAAILSMFLGT